MTFADPAFLAALLLVPIALGAYLLVQRRRQRYVVRFTNVDLLTNLVPRTPGLRRHVPTALYLGAIAFLAIALARPSMTLQVPREEATVMLPTPNGEIPFVARDYVLGFVLPNFFFHLTTAYALLRMKGVPIGKLDYLGAVR